MLERFGVKTSIVPSCGWSYIQPMKEGREERIPFSGSAGTAGKLIDAVRTFRINNGIDIGTLELDIAEYIRAASPLSRKAKRIPLASRREAKKRGFRPMIARVREWLQQKSTKEPRLVTEFDANERAEKCIGCPQNVKWVTGCLPCVSAVKARAANLRQRAGWEKDKNLGACRLHGILLPAAAFLDREELPEFNPSAPEFCWLKRP